MRALGRASPVQVGALGAGVALVIVVLRLLVAADGDISRFVVAGETFVDARTVDAEIHVARGSHGYDGQFFWRLAVDPGAWGQASDHGVRFDSPYRPPRIGYPVLAWLAAGGRPGLVAWSLVGVNVAAAGVVAGLGGMVARRAGRPAVWGLLVASAPGLVMALSRDLAEIVTLAGLMAGIVALQRGRPGLAAVAWSAAVLTREQALVVIAGYALHRLGRLVTAGRRRPPGDRVATPSAALAPVAGASTDWTGGTGRTGGTGGTDWISGTDLAERTDPNDLGDPGDRTGGTDRAGSADERAGWADLPWMVPALVFGGWQLVLGARLGELPLTASASGHNFTVPFAELVPALGRWAQGDIARLDVLAPVQLLLAVVLVVATFRRVGRRLAPPDRWLLVALGLIALVTVSFSRTIWDGPADLRHAADGFSLSWTALLLGPDRPPTWLVGATAAVWLATVAVRVVAI